MNNNFNDMMKKAQEMQKKMQEMQNSLSNLEVEGTSGGGMVKVIMNCKNEVKKIDVDPSIIKQDDKTMMEDLIVAALNDAIILCEEVDYFFTINRFQSWPSYDTSLNIANYNLCDYEELHFQINKYERNNQVIH